MPKDNSTSAPFSQEHVTGLETSASDDEIKKAYRKLALKYHPDKCGAPGAEEAFNCIKEAHSVLSNTDFRRVYDQTGQDPRSRIRETSTGSSNAYAHPGTHFGTFHFGGGMPEDILQELFAQMAGGQGFDGSFFSSSARFRGRSRQRQQQQADQRQNGAPIPVIQLVQILPLVLVLFFMLINPLLQLFTEADSRPVHSFTHSRTHNIQLTSQRRGVPYFVNLQRFETSYPAIPLSQALKEEATAVQQLNALYEGNAYFRRFETQLETQFLQQLATDCAVERQVKENKERHARKFFGLFVDKRELEAARGLRTPSCDLYQKYANADKLRPSQSSPPKYSQ